MVSWSLSQEINLDVNEIFDAPFLEHSEAADSGTSTTAKAPTEIQSPTFPSAPEFAPDAKRKYFSEKFRFICELYSGGGKYDDDSHW